MNEKIELAIIGAGPAGMGAAHEAARFNIPAIMIDAYQQAGGQYHKMPPREFNFNDDQDQKGEQLISELSHSGVRVFTDTVVWGIFPEEDRYLLCLFGPKGIPRRIHAKHVIIAPGAYDRPVPFPGWTLPGVILAGAALSLVKTQYILPGKRILLCGTGPLQWVLANRLINAGAEITGVLDANQFPWMGWRFASNVWGQWERLKEGWDSIKNMSKTGVFIQWGKSILRAEGNGKVERAVIGKPGSSKVKTLDVDTICLGYGFVPSSQLSLQAGCDHKYDIKTNSYTAVRDDWLQTTLPGIFIAGDGSGIGGKDVAILEGRLAGMGAARMMGLDVEPDEEKRLRRELINQRRFTAVLDGLFPFPRKMWDLISEDVTVCRCEEVTVGDVQQAVKEGATTLNAVKAITRAGMGRCQGRMCSGPVTHIISQASGKDVAWVGYATPRPPVFPVPVEGLLEE
jgi:thioredoxin reductase/bacterioferritin-associated ferredoxin